MIVEECKLPGVYEITLEPNVDHRGFFMRTYDQKIFSEYGIERNWVQENHSYSVHKGVIRGMHFQFAPFTETKLIRAVKGAIYDVFIDLRKESETFGQWNAIELSETNNKMIFIPRGFAHGFCTLTANSEIVYKVDNFYTPKSEGGIIWNDKTLNISWPVETPITSDKDSLLKPFATFMEQYGGI